jgi:hypothetical protein
MFYHARAALSTSVFEVGCFLGFSVKRGAGWAESSDNAMPPKRRSGWKAAWLEGGLKTTCRRAKKSFFCFLICRLKRDAKRVAPEVE